MTAHTPRRPRRRARLGLSLALLLAVPAVLLALGACERRGDPAQSAPAPSAAEGAGDSAAPLTPSPPQVALATPTHRTEPGKPSHGIALGGALKYPPGFKHFEYADPGAPRGGVLALSGLGSFDTLNPFGLKGRAPDLLGTLVFDTLTEGSLDEPFAGYGLVAETILPAADGLSVEFQLRPQARFADGKPLTAADVVFSFEKLRTPAAAPFYRYYYKDIKQVRALGPHTVRLTFARRNPELALIAGQMPILPRHFYGQGDFGRDFATRVLGSGPYAVAEVDPGKSIRYRRNPDYWARDLAVNAGRDNFAEILVKFYRDPTVRLEAFKAREFDFLDINSSKQWAVDVAGQKWRRGYMVKQLLPHNNNAGMQGFVFNLRRPLFAGRDLRHALSLAFDFDWSNRTLFYGQYTPGNSYFANSELAATGLPGPAELQLLEPLRGQVPPEVFTEAPAPLSAGHASIREQLRTAQRLLKRAGWEVREGVLTEVATGKQMRFTVTLSTPSWERIVEPYLNNLRKLGVQATMKVVDESIYESLLRTFDFEMIVQRIGQSQSPGNEQLSFWGSEAADTAGSRNLIGIKNPAVDALVQAIISAATRPALVAATRALDRVLWHEHYMVPHWYINTHRVTYWNKFSLPARVPLYYDPSSLLRTWWFDAARAAELAAAQKENRPVRREP